jgi:uncharacterized membrane protein YedE/YeeE
MGVSSSAIYAAAAGGLLIAVASSIHLLFKGRVTGMSGIFNGLITFDNTVSWKSNILSGLVLTAGLAYHLYGFKEVSNNIYLFDDIQKFNLGMNSATLIIAGLLVGLGTKLANGCTSGHGVCGLPRLSLRSFVAVMTFMATAILVANVKPHFLASYQVPTNLQYDPALYVNIAMIISALIPVVSVVKNKKGRQGIMDTIISFIVGSIFSVGLLVSGMARRSKVLGFLTFNKDWDISLMFVMGAAVLFNLITFNYVIRIKKKPILTDKLNFPTIAKVDGKLIAGAVLFGLGWGLGGICPGPSMIVTPVYFPSMIKFMISMGIGQYVAMAIEKQIEKVKAE